MTIIYLLQQISIVSEGRNHFLKDNLSNANNNNMWCYCSTNNNADGDIVQKNILWNYIHS